MHYLMICSPYCSMIIYVKQVTPNITYVIVGDKLSLVYGSDIVITDWLKSNKKRLNKDTCTKIVRDLEDKFGKGNVEFIGYVHEDCLIKINNITHDLDALADKSTLANTNI